MLWATPRFVFLAVFGFHSMQSQPRHAGALTTHPHHCLHCADRQPHRAACRWGRSQGRGIPRGRNPRTVYCYPRLCLCDANLRAAIACGFARFGPGPSLLRQTRLEQYQTARGVQLCVMLSSGERTACIKLLGTGERGGAIIMAMPGTTTHVSQLRGLVSMCNL
jgi:hypothetical protein